MEFRNILSTMHGFAGWGNFSTGTLKRIPIEFITNEFAFAFSAQGLNYFRRLWLNMKRILTSIWKEGRSFSFFSTTG